MEILFAFIGFAVSGTVFYFAGRRLRAAADKERAISEQLRRGWQDYQRDTVTEMERIRDVYEQEIKKKNARIIQLSVEIENLIGNNK